MTFETEVSTLRANANQALLSHIVNAAPLAQDIEPWHTLDALLWPDLPSNEDSRRVKLPSVIVEQQDELHRYIQRYGDLQTRALDALSNYDIGIAYRSYGPESGLAEALRSVGNHIGRCRAQVNWLLAEQKRVSSPQMALL